VFLHSCCVPHALATPCAALAHAQMDHRMFRTRLPFVHRSRLDRFHRDDRLPCVPSVEWVDQMQSVVGRHAKMVQCSGINHSERARVVGQVIEHNKIYKRRSVHGEEK
jgi:hypothetical protein